MVATSRWRAKFGSKMVRTSKQLVNELGRGSSAGNDTRTTMASLEPCYVSVCARACLEPDGR